jgi:hypothetical protein
MQSISNFTQSRGAALLNAGRWWLGLTGLFMAASVVPQALRNYRQWHSALVTDPSAADFWRTDFYLDLARIAAELIVAVAIFVFLKSRPNKSDASSDS